MRIDIFPTDDSGGAAMTAAIRRELDRSVPGAAVRVVTSDQPFEATR